MALSTRRLSQLRRPPRIVRSGHLLHPLHRTPREAWGGEVKMPRCVCARSTTGRCDGRRVCGSSACWRDGWTHPIRYRASGERRLIDETALAGIAYGADVNIGQLPAIVRAALRGETGPLIAAARELAPMSGSQAPGGPPDLALAGDLLAARRAATVSAGRSEPGRVREGRATRRLRTMRPQWTRGRGGDRPPAEHSARSHTLLRSRGLGQSLRIRRRCRGAMSCSRFLPDRAPCGCPAHTCRRHSVSAAACSSVCWPTCPGRRAPRR